MRRLLVEHHTAYRYREPVRFGEHRLMLTPRESHDLSIVDFNLTFEPGATLNWHADPFGNSVILATFEEPASELQIFSRLLIEHKGSNSLTIPLEQHAQRLPMLYADDEWPDLAATARIHWPDSQQAVRDWVDRFVTSEQGRTQDVLNALNHAIRDDFTYQVRHSPGIQTPVQTLESRGGSCRDFAVLMIEAARGLGLAARFVSGYLHDPSSDHALQGVGYTHAWAQIYLPGPGWVEYDPTNALINSRSLIRTAVARSPDQAVPVQGTFGGPRDAFVSMDVQVTVREISEAVLDRSRGESMQIPTSRG